MAAIDATGDGVLDLVEAESPAVGLFIHPGNGNGTFQGQTGGTPDATPGRLASGDLNRDGRADLAFFRTDEGSIAVALGKPGGGFSVSTVTRPFAFDEQREIAVGDLNRDGKPDLLATDGSIGLHVLLGTGTGTFGNPTYIGGAENGAAAIADLNLDGAPDVVATDLEGFGLLFVPGKGSGAFGSQSRIQASATAVLLNTTARG